MLGKVIPAGDVDGIRFWIQINGVFRKRFNVYRVVAVSDFGTVVHFEEIRTKYPHKRHVSMLDTGFFKPFLIPGGKKNG